MLPQYRPLTKDSCVDCEEFFSLPKSIADSKNKEVGFQNRNSKGSETSGIIKGR